MEGTGVYATEEEFRLLKAAAEQGWACGETVIALSVGQGMAKDEATVGARLLCHRVALKHGLPEIFGYYGIKKDGEFMLS